MNPAHIEQILRWHNIPDAVALAVVRVGERLHTRMTHTGSECAAAIEINTAEAVGGIIDGDRARVDVRPLLRQMRRGHRYVLLHTHPGSAPPSLADGVVLMAHSRMAAIVVVGLDGTWYVLSRRSRMFQLSAGRLVGLWREVVVTLRPAFAARIAGGELSKANAEIELLHHTWLTIAPRARLHYDRVAHVSGEEPR